MTTNIGNTNDPFYRYKRPISIIENRKNNTIIKNIDNIAKSLHTETKYILYYIQLAKSVVITPKGEIKAILNKNEIEELINKYIDVYILCKKCKYPELVIKKHNNNKLYYSCNACGYSIDIPEDKFTKIIYKDIMAYPN